MSFNARIKIFMWATVLNFCNTTHHGPGLYPVQVDDLTTGARCVRLTSNTRDADFAGAVCWLLGRWLLDNFICNVHSGPPQMALRASLLALRLQL